MRTYDYCVAQLSNAQRRAWKALQNDFHEGQLPVFLHLRKLEKPYSPYLFKRLNKLGLIDSAGRGEKGTELTWVCQSKQDWLEHAKEKENSGKLFAEDLAKNVLQLTPKELLFLEELQKLATEQGLPLCLKRHEMPSESAPRFLLKLRSLRLVQTENRGCQGVEFISIYGYVGKASGVFVGCTSHPAVIPPVDEEDGFELVGDQSMPPVVRLWQLQTLGPKEWQRYEQMFLPSYLRQVG